MLGNLDKDTMRNYKKFCLLLSSHFASILQAKMKVFASEKFFALDEKYFVRAEVLVFIVTTNELEIISIHIISNVLEDFRFWKIVKTQK